MLPGFASEFPRTTAEQWRALAEAVLKGADFEKTLVSKTLDGIRIEPLYPKAEGAAPILRATYAPWRVVQRVDHPEPGLANELALADLAGGAGALAFLYAGAPSVRGFGVEAASLDSLDHALRGVMLDLIEIRLETAPFQGPAAASQWIGLAERRKLDSAALTVDFGLDAIGDIARTGRPPAPWTTLAGRMADTTRRVRDAGFAGPTVRVDTRAYHEAGASEAQELAAALATGVAYLRALEGGGHIPEAARDALTFLIVADADQFLTVAKLRALRRLWAEVEQACGLEPKPIRLQAETAWRMTTRRDPWVNLLRGTLAAFSAGIGGADGVTVLPYTAALGLPDAFARRLARNTQSILIEESNLWRIADPVAGSGGFEALTVELADTAWRLFQEIEREGGIAASLEAGAIQNRIAAMRAERSEAIATRRAPITGTSEFPDLAELPVAVLQASPRERGEDELRGAQPGEWASQEEPHSPAPPHPTLSPQAGRGAARETSSLALPSIRDAEPFEALRDRSDAILAATGTRPKAFLANLGPLAAFSARAAFAKNAFEAGGIEAIGNDGFDDPHALAAAFAASGARIACLCSSDAIYAEQGRTAAAALKSAGAALIYVVGCPSDQAEPIGDAGVDYYIHPGSNLLAALRTAVRSA